MQGAEGKTAIRAGVWVAFFQECQQQSCKQAALRKFTKSAKAMSGADLKDMLSSILHHPAHMAEVFEALKELAPNRDSTKDEECASLAREAEVISQQIKHSRDGLGWLERWLAKAALSCCGWPFALLCLLLMAAVPLCWPAFWQVVKTFTELRAARKVIDDSQTPRGRTPRTPHETPRGGTPKHTPRGQLAAGNTLTEMTQLAASKSLRAGMAHHGHSKRLLAGEGATVDALEERGEMMRTHSRMLSHLSQEQEDKDVYSAEGKGAQGTDEPSTTAATEEQQEDEAGRFLTETAMSLDMSKLNRAETSRALGGGTPRERLAAEQEKRKQANLAAASFPLIVMTGVVEALRDLKVTLGMILNIFGREALSDLGCGSYFFASFFLLFPPLWYFVLGHGGMVGKPIFEANSNCTYTAPLNATTYVAFETNATTGVTTNYTATNFTAAKEGVLDCGWAAMWHVPFFILFYGLCFGSVFMLLLLRWVHLDQMYDCPTYSSSLRPSRANTIAVYSLVMGYYAFFNVSLNLHGGVKWPYADTLKSAFPRELFAFWKAPCSDPTIIGDQSSTFVGWVCNDAMKTVQEFQLLALTLLWAFVFQLASVLPSVGPFAKLDEFCENTMVPLLADACYMMIAQACLDQVDCTQQNDGKFTLDADGSVECWTDKTQADGSMAHNLKVLVAMWSFGLYFPVAVRAA